MGTTLDRKVYLISSNSMSSSFMGTRDRALKIRDEIEALLRQGQDVEINFSNVAISQSFADELIGVLLLKNGPDILNKLVFKDCSESVKAAIEFVVADRYDQFVKTKTH